jgi:carboxyl-terminal processing protease
MKKVLLVIVAVFVVLIMLSGAFSGGVIVGRFIAPKAVPSAQVEVLPPQTGQNSTESAPTPLSPTKSAPPTRTGTPNNLVKLFEPFWQTWQIVHEQYVDQPVDDEKMMQGAIRGMLESLGDQHTSYMDPDQFRQANIPLEGEYEGIGAWVDPTGEFLTIVSPMPDSPAEKAGLKPGDQVIAVDGDDMTGIDGNLVIRRVLGPAGSKVMLTIRREGVEEPFDVEIVRAHIVVPSLESKMLEGNLAYVHLFNFGENTNDELRRVLKELLDQKPVGLILDLRNNGGGALNTAIRVASEFVGEGVIMYEQYGDGSRDTYTAFPGGLATDIPLVVLINEGTASASEIVAGAVQDYGRGQLVGVTSFGKGSVQNWIPLKDDEGAVRITIARWLTPKERTIHETGLTPDVEVKLTDEDITANRDPQLDKAVELLTKK